MGKPPFCGRRSTTSLDPSLFLGDLAVVTTEFPLISGVVSRVSAAVPQVLSSLQRSSNEERCITRPGDSGIYDVQLGLFKVKTLLDLLGSLLGGGKGRVQVTMIWDIWNPTHLLRARQGHGLHPGIPGRLEA